MISRADIFARYSWLAPGDEPETVIIGDDLDSALSAVLFLHFHPNARLVGLYHGYEKVVFSPSQSWTQVCNSVWLDLDIYHPDCRSLGHHILRLSARDHLPGFATSCNLNELAGKSFDNFAEKYPLGTIHFLMWLYGVETPESDDVECLIWLADSSYINGQSKYWRRTAGGLQQRNGYRWNVNRWLRHQIPLKSLQSTFAKIETLAFEERMREFQQRLEKQGFRQGSGQAASQHLKLSGYQCQPDGDLATHTRRLLEFVIDVAGWSVDPPQIAGLEKWTISVSGRRQRVEVAAIRAAGLERFLTERDVFSYVFQSRATMNYTQGMRATGSASGC